MEFITTGNRIAVENFEIGYFYTITMLSGNYFQACCTGIGSDFVMFSRDEPDLLYSLTMKSAADVSSIELYEGGSGTNDYNALINKPQINSITLIGNKSLSDLGIQETISDLDTIRSGAAAGATAVQPAAMATALAAKQDTLSSAQLAAVNSGIDSTKVGQIEINKNNISKQQDSTASGGNGYAIINGQRLYMGTAPMPERTGDIWLDGTTARESGYLLSANPLCGIGGYKDTLNLATGACERNIKKLVLHGTENWGMSGSGETSYFGLYTGESQDNLCMSSHFEFNTVTSSTSIVGIRMSGVSQNIRIRPQNVSAMSVDDFKSWLAQEYANGTPVTVWYILATTATETITVPSGNVGTVEGYLIQDGTPTQSSPVYPTANEVLGWKQ